MAHLYVNSKGYEVHRHSYSGSDTFRFCAAKYNHQRLGGWQDKEKRVSLQFGIAVESAVKFHHENGLSGGAEEFTRLWNEQKNQPLIYTATEGSWEELDLSGREMLVLYAVRLSKLPIAYEPKPKFQTQFTKEVFPGTELAGIDFIAYVDMLAFTRKELVEPGEFDGLITGQKKLLIDIKTSGVMLDTTPGILALDQQLRSYAWVTGIPNVAFLNFVKTNRELSQGTKVVLLRDCGDFKAGDSAIVAHNHQNDEVKPVFDPVQITLVRDETHLDEMKKAMGEKPKSKEGKLNKVNFLAREGLSVSLDKITKQRIQFLTAHIDQTAQEEIATQVGEDIARIVHSAKESFWPKQGGVRFPNNKCVSCSCLGLCLKNDQIRDERLVRIDDGVFGEE